MHGHSSDSTNAVIQFIQMENVLKILLNGQQNTGLHDYKKSAQNNTNTETKTK